MEVIKNIVYVDEKDIVNGKLVLDCNETHIRGIIMDKPYLVNEIEIREPIKVMASHVFNSFSFVKKIVFLNSMNELPSSFLENSSYLQEIILPSTLKKISSRAFAGCSQLKQITGFSELKVIGEEAFLCCIKLKEINLPLGIEHIGKNAFLHCEALNKINLPESIIAIGKAAFAYTAIKNIKIPSKLEEIESSLFSNCKELESIMIPSNIKIIKEDAFARSSIKEIQFEDDSVEIIEDNAFRYCISLNDIKLPSSLKTIKKKAFFLCENLKNIEFANKIKKIGECVFFGCNNLEEVIIPDSVTSIGQGAFVKCTNIAKLKLSNRLKEIKENTFSDCSSLVEIEVPSSVKCIEKQAFYNCNNLKKIVLHEGLEEIDDEVFYDCSSLEEINLPKSLTKIGISAFLQCISLTKVIIPNQISEISPGLFFKCVKLKEVVMGENVEKISRRAFSHCSSLKQIYIPKSVKSVEESAFSSCKNLTFVNMYSDTCIDFAPIGKTLFNIEHNLTGNKKLVEVNPGDFVIESTGFLLGWGYYNYSFFDLEGNWVSIKGRDDDISPKFYKKLYQWEKIGKYTPSIGVVAAMPLDEIKSFFINGNSKRWQELVRLHELEEIDKEGLFKFCYVMGLFSNKGRISNRAFEFVKEAMQGINLDDYHIFFNGLDIEKNRYNNEFCELILKENKVCQGPSFLFNIAANNSFCAIYNGMDKIKKVYPNKKVKTNRRVDELTFDMCLELIKYTKYDGVDKGNEEFACNIGMYGYTQQEFDRAQRLFNVGKNIPQDEITLLIKDDKLDEGITYQLLDKDNPLGVILGNITNCCQTLNGAGRECLEYGLSKRNSKFMIFKFKNQIIGQSWVWYDENTKKICLDNIEVPSKFLHKEFKYHFFNQMFIECLKRSVDGFLLAMEEKDLEVNSITIGEGYNDIKDMLRIFPRLVNQPKLSDYSGYSDASNQYVLFKR